VRINGSKVLLLAVALVAIALVPSASATTCPAGDACFSLTQSNLGSGSFGNVVVAPGSGSTFTVTVTMNPGYTLVTQGGFIGVDTSTPLSVSLSGFSISGMSAGLQPNNGVGGFTFSDLFKTSLNHGQQFPTTLTFTLSGVSNINQITGFASISALTVQMVAAPAIPGLQLRGAELLRRQFPNPEQLASWERA